MADETTVESTETAAQANPSSVTDTTHARPSEDTSASPQDATTDTPTEGEPAAKKTAAKRTAKKTTKKVAAKRTTKKAEPDAEATGPVDDAPASDEESADEAPAKKTAKRTATKKAATKKTAARRTTKKAADEAPAASEPPAAVEPPVTDEVEEGDEPVETEEDAASAPPAPPAVLFQAPPKTATRRRTRKAAEPAETSDPVVEEAVGDTTEPVEQAEPAEKPEKPAKPEKAAKAEKPDKPEKPEKQTSGGRSDKRAKADQAEDQAAEAEEPTAEEGTEESGEGGGNGRRRRRRGGRRRRKSNNAENGDSESSDESSSTEDDTEDTDSTSEAEQSEGSGSSRRRRRRRRAGEAAPEANDDPQNTVTKVRSPKAAEDQITALSGSTRLEAKKQRRREGREAGRRRAPIVSEAEFLARRESVDRVMVIRQRDDLTQIAVLEDKVLVEHYVARESQTSLIGNVYLGRVQNVLPSMEAAFIDIGKGRNAVLYAGEVNWHALGWKEGQPRKIESVLTSGQKVLVQVTKDPIGHKGARLTSQISLAGRFLVYVPDGTTSGISRKLPDTERNRLKSLLREIVPDTAGVIVRTAAEGAAEEELTRDVERLKARWDDIEKKTNGNAPQLLYGEPDLTLKVVRDLFTEDFSKLVVSGEDAWDTVQGYVHHVAPDLEERLERYSGDGDAFAAYRIDEQIAKGLDRKVWLPSGGSLIIDRTEAMTVVDVNTGKFTGSGGNLEETVTKNNLEAAEEIVRQLRLRDIGGIIVVDFIDMVLESNRDLVLRRLVECLGRDRTRHQVAEVTSLGLVQMTRKRIGTGLLEAFSETCDACSGRGLVIHDHPVEAGRSSGVAPDEPRSRRRRGGRGKGGSSEQGDAPAASAGSAASAAEDAKAPSPAEFAAMAAHAEKTDEPADQPAIEPAKDEPAAASAAEPAVEEPAEPAAPKVTTRTRARRSRKAAAEPAAEPAAGPSEEAPAGDTSAAPAAEPAPVQAPAEPEPAQTAAPAETEPAAEPAPEPAAAPADGGKPKVVTRVRRGASRSVVSTGEGKVLSAADPAPLAPSNGSPIAATPPPKVVTRVRGGARRDAAGEPTEDK